MLPIPRACLEAIRPYKPGKPVEQVVRELGIRGQVIKLASNENPLGPSTRALAALRKNLHELHYYPEDSCHYLRQKLSQLFKVDSDAIIIGNGSVELILLACLAYLETGDELIMTRGAFIMPRIGAAVMNAKVVEVEPDDYRHNLRQMSEAVNQRTKIIYLDNPINPLGTIVTRQELDSFFDRIPDHVLVILDEAYAEYISSREYPKSLDYYNANRNVLILRTMSKIYGLAGLRVGYGFARPEIVESLAKVRLPFNVSRAAQVAAVAAFDDKRHVQRSRRVNEAGKTMFYKEFKRLKLFYLESYANFVFVNFAIDAQLIFEELQRRGVITRTVREYGFPNALRVTVGTEPQNRRFLKALDEVMAALLGG
ncbi:MAG: histidinol-phosphate transaminase [candidate division WOR-3 bacterium]